MLISPDLTEYSLTKEHLGEQRQRATGGTETIRQIWFGDKASVESAYENYPVGTPVEGGQISSSRIYQKAGPRWAIELNITAGTGDSITVTFPDTDYGEIQTQISGSLLQLPLEKCPNYRTKWKYYLIARSKNSAGPYPTPSWWESNTEYFNIITEGYMEYKMVENLSDIPTDANSAGYYWQILQSPTKPGVAYYSKATYQITETARFRTLRQAFSFGIGKLNQIVTPHESVSLSGNWKVENISANWDGKAWAATRIMTLSGDSSGWDPDLL